MEKLSYIYIFMQSNLLEIPIYFAIYKLCSGSKNVSLLRVAIVTTLANSITHPIVFFGFMSAPGWNYLQAILVAESFAVLAETFLHRLGGIRPKLSQNFTAALLANLFSWQLGPMLTYWLFLS